VGKIRLGLLGCASIARRHMIPAAIELGQFDLVAVASRDEKKGEDFSSQFKCESVIGYETLVKRTDLDAIYIPLPVGLHHRWTKRCLEEHKHVLVEKSFVPDLSSVQDLTSLASTNNLVIMENFAFLFHSQLKHVQQLIRCNEIGDVRSFRSAFGFPPRSSGDIRYDRSLGGGALLDAGTYTLRSTQTFLGSDLTVKSASLNIDRSSGVDIFGSAHLVNRKGLSSTVSFGFDNFYQCMYEIWGSKGRIIVERAYTAAPDFKPTLIIESINSRKTLSLKPDNQFKNILTEFHRRIINSKHRAQQYDELINQARLLEETNMIAQRTVIRV